jgi:hypothetical protein
MNTLLKTLIVIAVIIAGTVIMLTLGAVFIVRNIHVHETESSDKKNVRIETPLGSIGIHKNDGLDPETVGIPVYPGAQRSEDKGGVDFQLDGSDLHKDFSVSAATYYSSDAPGKVREFYQHQFPEWHTHWERDALNIEIKQGGRLRSVIIKPDGEGTRIAVASVGPPASN